jgi:hypothetical protein
VGLDAAVACMAHNIGSLTSVPEGLFVA